MGAIALLGVTGAGVGTLAASLTDAAVVWRAPARFAMTAPAVPRSVDHGEAGRAWARVAFDGGLRRCPDMNPAFLAACHAEIKALASRPALAAGSYGGPLLITKFEPLPEPRFNGYEPEIEPSPELTRTVAMPEASLTNPPDEPTPDNYPAAFPPE